MTEAALRRAFERRFGMLPEAVARAPGRVNLIGEHTDYNDGWVMPVAIDRYAWVAAATNGEGALIAETRQSVAPGWQRRLEGLAGSLGVRGAVLLVDSGVPIGAGLSSSAALEVAAGAALLQLAGARPQAALLARAAQRAEHEFAGARCGIMDPLIACVGRAGHAALLDCRSLEVRQLPLPAGIALVICDTGVKHSLAGGEYNRRRSECEEGACQLGVGTLREVTPERWAERAGALPEVIFRRCRHVLEENRRVLAAAAALERSDLEGLGALMRQSHESLRDNFEVSCAELDRLAERAWAHPAVVGHG